MWKHHKPIRSTYNYLNILYKKKNSFQNSMINHYPRYSALNSDKKVYNGL